MWKAFKKIGQGSKKIVAEKSFNLSNDRILHRFKSQIFPWWSRTLYLKRMYYQSMFEKSWWHSKFQVYVYTNTFSLVGIKVFDFCCFKFWWKSRVVIENIFIFSSAINYFYRFNHIFWINSDQIPPFLPILW